MRLLLVGFVCGCAALAGTPAGAAPQQAWIERSNAYTNRLLAVQFEHSPERGSHEGLVQFDERISDPALADELAERKQLEAVLAAVESEGAKETDKRVQQDLAILRKAFDLKFRKQDYELQHEVPFDNASELVFEGLRVLLDDQVDAQRRPAALVRLRKYAGSEPGTQPFTAGLKQRVLEQVAKPGVIYPSRGEIETELSRNAAYLEGISQLFTQYHLSGWQEPFTQLKSELAAYDAWVREAILPKARTDFRLPPEKYALAFEEYGIDLPPQKIAAMAHEAFPQYQAEMGCWRRRSPRRGGCPRATIVP
jgi:hypothetical protein